MVKEKILHLKGTISFLSNDLCYDFSRRSNTTIFFCLPSQCGSTFNPIALRTAKTQLSFGCSECQRVKNKHLEAHSFKGRPHLKGNISSFPLKTRPHFWKGYIVQINE